MTSRYEKILQLEQIISDNGVVVPLSCTPTQLLISTKLTDWGIMPCGNLVDPKSVRIAEN